MFCLKIRVSAVRFRPSALSLFNDLAFRISPLVRARKKNFKVVVSAGPSPKLVQPGIR